MKKYKILIVDDLETNLSILNKLLKRHGFDTDTALSGKIALEKLDEFQPAIVLLDISMPEMDGFECCQKIREKNKNIFVIFVTALSDRVTRDKSFEVGGTDILTKPVDIKLLLNKINSTLDMKSQIDTKEKEVEKYVQQSSQYEKTYAQFSKLKDIGSLASTIAHDINNYLGGILGNLDLIELTTENKEVLRYCTNIKKAVDNTANLTQQLTQYTKHDSEDTINLKTTLDEAVRLIERDVKYHVNIETEYSKDQYKVKGLKSQFSNVFMNLLKNACESTGANGKIRVKLYQAESLEKETFRGILKKGTYAVVSFNDNGCGIPQDKLAEIFEPFYTTKEKGSGLGLTSVLKYVDSHDGGIDIDSKVGEGTTITLYIPILGTPPVYVKPQDLTKEVLLSLDQQRFLLVDDDKIFCNSVSKFITKNEGQVKAFSESSFCEFFKDSKNLIGFNYLIIDFKLPFADAFSVIERVKKLNPDLKSLIISGSFVDIEDLDDCFFLRKPVSLSKVLNILNSVPSK